MARKAESDSQDPAEFLSYLELATDEFGLVCLAIGMVFGLLWIVREVFRVYFAD